MENAFKTDPQSSLIHLLEELHAADSSQAENRNQDLKEIVHQITEIENFSEIAMRLFSHKLVLRGKYVEAMRTVIRAPWFREFLLSLIVERKDYRALKDWTDVILSYFPYDTIVAEHTNYIRRDLCYKMGLLVDVLITPEPEAVQYLFYWGVYPYRDVAFPKYGTLSLLELGVTLGAREMLRPETEHNRVLKALLRWHQAQRFLNFFGCFEVTQRGPICHYALAAGNIEALSLLLQFGIDPRAHDCQGHNFIDLLIEYPNISKYQREFYNFFFEVNSFLTQAYLPEGLFDLFRQAQREQLLGGLFEVFMHQDSRGLRTYERLYDKLGDKTIPEEMKEFYKKLYNLMLRCIAAHISKATTPQEQKDDRKEPGWLCPLIVDKEKKRSIVDFALESSADAISDSEYNKVQIWLDLLYEKGKINELGQVFRHTDIYGVQTWQRLICSVSQLKQDDNNRKSLFMRRLHTNWLRLILCERLNRVKEPIVWPEVPPISLPADKYFPIKGEPLAPSESPLLMSQGVGESPRVTKRKSFKN